MSKNTVEIPFEGKAGEKAVLLLAAATSLGLPAAEVKTIGGGFRVPREIAEEAGLSESDEARGSEDDDDKPKARKRAAKKAAPKSDDNNDTQE